MSKAQCTMTVKEKKPKRKNNEPVAIDFNTDVDVKENGCWEWKWSRAPKGYGQVWIDKTMVRIHRLSYIQEVGPIPEGLHVLHQCHNPPCCNPSHLKLGTNQENLQEKSNNKLTPADVRKIRLMLEEGYRGIYIADVFNVTPMTISHIKSNRTWQNVI